MAWSFDRRKQEGSALILTVMMLALLLMLSTTLLVTATVESSIASNDRWSEGSFYAAEAAVHVALDQLIASPTNPQPVAETELGDHYVYRSGGREDTEPQPPEALGTISAEGYSIGEGTTYNSAGFVFDIYQINGTGSGPLNSQREIEIQVQVGPVAR